MKELIIFASGIVMGAWLLEEFHDEISELWSDVKDIETVEEQEPETVTPTV